MPVDPSIILGIKPVQFESPVEMQKSAMQLQQAGYQNQMMQRQMNDDQATRAAYQAAMTAGPDGTPTLDRQKFTQTLAAQNPMLAYQKSQEFPAQDAAKAKAQLEISKNQHEQAANYLSEIRRGPGVPPEVTQSDYERATAKALAAGIPGAANAPKQYPGDSYINNALMQTLDGKSQLEMQLKQQEANNKSRELGIEYHKTYGGEMPGSNMPSYGKAAIPGKGASGKGVDPSDIDPASLVSARVPPSLQAKAFDQIEAAQNTAQNAPKILEAFDKAANNLHAADFVPGMANADQKALHALMGPTFKDVEGTVRQAAMDNMNNNTTPQFGDDANTIKTKRAALEGYLKSKSSAPTVKGFGIDLSKFKSTNYDLGSVVNMQAPDGTIRAVPKNQVDAAIKAGGKQI